MRNNDIDHYFIDTCAGSGKVQAYGRDEYIDGSPLIMLKTRDWVQEKIKDKNKPKHAKCILIEVNEKTYKLLEKWTEGFLSREKVVRGDCNKELPNVLDEIESESRKPFALIYIDPFGLGDPPIEMEMLKRVLERDYTELFLQLDVDGIARVVGVLEGQDNIDSNESAKSKSYEKTLRIFFGDEGFERLHSEWPKLRKGEREQKILEYYISGIKGYFPRIKHIEIPIGSRRPSYYLIFTTRNKTGEKIMGDIIEKTRKRKFGSLDEYLQ